MKFIKECHNCGGPYPAYGFVVARDERNDPVHGWFCLDCREIGRRKHNEVMGLPIEQAPAAPDARPFDKPPPQQDGQGRLF